MSQHPVDIAANLAREWERRAKDAESQNQALQEALEKIRDDKGDVVHGGYVSGERLQSIARNALSPTQETDPKTAHQRDVEDDMRDPEYRAAYEAARIQETDPE